MSVDEALCDGCGICLFYCRPVVFEFSIELNARGFYPALPTRPEACTFCRLCEVACPQFAVTVRVVSGRGA